jgi:hypothetical protein
MKWTPLVLMTMVVAGLLLKRSHAIASPRRGAVAMSSSPETSSSMTVLRRWIERSSVAGAVHRSAVPAAAGPALSRCWTSPAFEISSLRGCCIS